MKKKLIILYLVFTIIPLAILDAVVVGGILRSEQTKRYHEMENVASAIKYACSAEFESAVKVANSIYTSKYIYDFINEDFDSALEYYTIKCRKCQLKLITFCFTYSIQAS